VDRRQLEYFLAVAAHGSFTSAAASLHVAQPSLSHAIKSLEREVGAQLFHRLSRGVKLTAAGGALLRPAQQVLMDFAAASTAVHMVSDLTAGRLDIVAQTTLAVHPLADLVGAFRKAYPAVVVGIEDPEHAAAVAEMVRNGQSELGLTDLSVSVEDLRTYELPDQEILVVLPPDTDIGPDESLTVAQVVAFDLIVTPPGTNSRAILESALSRTGVPLRVAVETPHRAAIVPLVLAGAGATLLPRSMAEDAARQGARIATLDPPVVRRVQLLWRREPLSPAGRAFVRMVMDAPGGDSSALPEGAPGSPPRADG
jgi:LysR family transcriptional regulator, carnitine catabolism transcriptional activator